MFSASGPLTFLQQCLDGEVSQADLDLIDHVTVRSFPMAALVCTSCEYLSKKHGSNLINLPKTDSVVIKNAKSLEMTHSAVRVDGGYKAEPQ
jgi:hypothetical protein